MISGECVNTKLTTYKRIHANQENIYALGRTSSSAAREYFTSQRTVGQNLGFSFLERAKTKKFHQTVDSDKFESCTSSGYQGDCFGDLIKASERRFILQKRAFSIKKVNFQYESSFQDSKLIVFVLVQIHMLLHKVFTTMDKQAEKFGLLRVKTIGDAYMACAGERSAVVPPIVL